MRCLVVFLHNGQRFYSPTHTLTCVHKIVVQKRPLVVSLHYGLRFYASDHSRSQLLFEGVTYQPEATTTCNHPLYSLAFETDPCCNAAAAWDIPCISHVENVLGTVRSKNNNAVEQVTVNDNMVAALCRTPGCIDSYLDDIASSQLGNPQARCEPPLMETLEIQYFSQLQKCKGDTISLHVLKLV